MMNPPEHFIYQHIHALNGKAFHLADHLKIAARAFEHIYGFRPDLDGKILASRIAETLRSNHPAARTSALVMLRVIPTEEDGCEVAVEYERGLLDAGYTHSPLRPKAVAYEYAIPFGASPTGFQLSARALFDALAFRQHSATRSVRRQGDRLLSCGDAPLFAIRGRELFTPPLADGAIESVERELVLDAAGTPKARLKVREESIPHSELKSFDELFFADAAGITSLSECDGAKFMSLLAPRLADALSGKWKVES